MYGKPFNFSSSIVYVVIMSQGSITAAFLEYEYV